MKSIMTTYPNFQALPRGIKRLLLASETFFFGEAQAKPADVKPAGMIKLNWGWDLYGRLPALGTGWRN